MNNDRTQIDTCTPATANLTPSLAADATTMFLVGDAIPTSAPPGYEFVSLLGRGGMGVVYRARQVSLNRAVALKTISLGPHSHPSSAARFEQEAQTIARLQHPHIVTAFDFGNHDGRLFLAMELVEGEDVEAFIRARTRLDEATTWGLIRQAAMGLAHAASHGIVHRDVKPANMLLVTPPAGYPLPPGLPLLKLTDFGLAFLAEDHRDSRLTQEGTTLGSPHYMAPEQISGGQIDLRTDIYGLGATAYQMLTGVPPFPGEKAGQVFANKLKGITPAIGSFQPEVNQDTIALVARMMRENPDERPANYAELLHRIDNRATASAPPRRKSKHARFAWSSHSRGFRRTMVGLALVAVAAMVVLPFALRGPTPITVQKLVLTGRSEHLFDGKTLRGWLPKGGQWLASTDADGGRVIKGAGVLRRASPYVPARGKPWGLYRVSVGCDLGKATAAELQFNFTRGDAGRRGPRWVLRLEKDRLRIGTRDGDAAPFAESAATPLPAASEDDGPRYCELRVERHARGWLAFCNGKPFAAVDSFDDHQDREIRLVAEGGEAVFDEPMVSELAGEPLLPG